MMEALQPVAERWAEGSAMNTAVKIAGFATALAAAFGGAYGVGSAVGPSGAGPAPTAHTEREGHRPDGGGGARGGFGGEAPVGGLRVVEDGYALDLATPRIAAGEEAELRFTVRDGDGRPVTAYRAEHGRELHLILASRDLATYRHLHPVRAGDGTWSAPVELPRAGDYRVFADFTPDAEGAGGVTLGADLAVSGAYEPAALPEPSPRATVDGYTVTLDGALRPGRESTLGLEVTRGGRPVTDLEPHLGASGHLVALRAGDLGYLHVHPEGAPGDGAAGAGPVVSFATTAPSSGTYRLFLEFKHDGKVRTAAFTVTAGAGRGTDAPAPGAGHGEGPHGH